MANTRSANVIVVDTSAAFAENLQVVGIKYIAGTGSPSIIIKSNGSAAGVTVYEEDGAADKFEEVKLRDARGLHVAIAGTGTKAYLYLA